MPYSRNYASYPPFFTDLIKSFTNGPADIVFHLPDQTACKKVQLQFYAFIRALEDSSHKFKKQGDVQKSSDLLSLATLGRTRSVEVTISNNINDVSYDLHFIARDSIPEIASMARQLEQMNIETTPLLNTPSPDDDWEDSPILDEFAPKGDNPVQVDLASLLIDQQENSKS